MKPSGKILVAGSLVLDILPSFVCEDGEWLAQTLLAQGKLTESSGFTIYLGGEVGNTGLALHRLGVPVRLMSKVGDDSIGGIVKDMLAATGVESALTVMPQTNSTASIALALPGRDKCTIHLRGASQLFTAEDFTAETFSDIKLLHFGYPTTMKHLYQKDGEGLTQLLRTAHECGTATSLDTSLPDLKAEPGRIDWRPILPRILEHLDLFLPSLEEALFMTDRVRYEALVKQAGSRDLLELLSDEDICSIAAYALEKGTAVSLIKCGSKGMYLRTAQKDRLEKTGLFTSEMLEAWSERELWISPCRVEKVCSTTGAGDTAVAGFLCALHSGYSPEEAMQLAAYTAACCVASYDTIGKLQGAKEMLDGMQTAPHVPPAISKEIWTAGVTEGLYFGPLDQNRKGDG